MLKSHCHAITLSHSNTLSFNHSPHAEQLLFSWLCSKVTLTLSLCHTLTLTLSRSHALTLSHSLSLDMLNNFCFHVYAQKSLFKVENVNAYFLTSSSSAAASAPREFANHRAGSQLNKKLKGKGALVTKVTTK